MTWLVPSVLATLISSLVLSFAYLVLAYIENREYLWIWFWAWLLSSFRFAFMLLYIQYPGIGLYALINLQLSLFSGLLLYLGTIYWLELKTGKFVIVLGLLISANSIIGHYLNTSFFYKTAPVFFYVGGIYLVLGWNYLRQKENKFSILIGIFFVIWGLHKLDYPFVRQISVLAPLGYMLGTTLSMLVAVSMILLYLINTKKDLTVSNKKLQTDIRIIKDIELENSKQKQIAGEATRVKDNFLSNISHELRTPLNGAIGMIELLRSLEQAEESKYYLDLAAQSVDRLFSIVKDLLDFVQIDSGNLGLIIESLDFEKMINHTVELFSKQLNEKGLSILSINQGNTKIFTGDKARTAQIIISLLSNAVKFSNKGKITISYSIDPNLHISISDEGIGIPKEKIDTIFNVLEQLEDPYTKKFDGLGLGLAIVKNLIDLMEGKMTVKSELGKGTVFYITIPGSEQIPLKIDKKEKSALSPEEFTILIAEDESISRIYIREILRKNNFPVLEAINGKEVLDLLKTNHPELILMDINMPVLNGLDATIQLRKTDKFKKKPIFALTAYTGKNDIAQYLSAGFNEVLAKPIDENNLIDKIKEYAK